MPHEVNAFRERLRTYATERASQPAVRGMTGNVTYAQLMVEVERREAWLREQAKGLSPSRWRMGPKRCSGIWQHSSPSGLASSCRPSSVPRNAGIV